MSPRVGPTDLIRDLVFRPLKQRQRQRVCPIPSNGSFFEAATSIRESYSFAGAAVQRE